MFKRLAKQLKVDNDENVSFLMSSPFKSLQEETKDSFLKSLSKHALNLYERKTDVKNFTKLALSNPENTSHNKIVDELFGQDGVVDPFEDDKLFELSDNARLLRDLGLKD